MGAGFSDNYPPDPRYEKERESEVVNSFTPRAHSARRTSMTTCPGRSTGGSACAQTPDQALQYCGFGCAHSESCLYDNLMSSL